MSKITTEATVDIKGYGRMCSFVSGGN